MSLLNQMRPSISEKHTRNEGVRSNYDPHFNLYKHITIPDVRTVTAHNHLLSVDRVKLLGKEPKTEICLYQTLHGKLDKDLIKKFSDSLFWNSAYKSEFINFLGSNIRCDSRTHEPHSDMFAALDKAPPPVDREAQEWQQVRATSNGLLHEDKVWEPRNPRPWFQTDPHQPRTWQRKEKKLRSDEEERIVQNKIWDLVKRNDLYYQYREEIPGYTGFKVGSVNPKDPLGNPPGHNPLRDQSVIHAAYSRYNPHYYQKNTYHVGHVNHF